MRSFAPRSSKSNSSCSRTVRAPLGHCTVLTSLSKRLHQIPTRNRLGNGFGCFPSIAYATNSDGENNVSRPDGATWEDFKVRTVTPWEPVAVVAGVERLKHSTHLLTCLCPLRRKSFCPQTPRSIAPIKLGRKAVKADSDFEKSCAAATHAHHHGVIQKVENSTGENNCTA